MLDCAPIAVELQVFEMLRSGVVYPRVLPLLVVAMVMFAFPPKWAVELIMVLDITV
jgi:hypothetical protein